RRARVLNWVGYNYRWAPLVQFARQLVAGGKLGRQTHYRGRFLVDYGSNADSVLSWRFRREEAGLGTLGDLLSHVIDMAHPPARRAGGRPAAAPLSPSGRWRPGGRGRIFPWPPAGRAER